MSQEIIITDKDVPKEVIDAVVDGRKIIAIKLLREATGLGLANAKVIVDRIATQQARNNPTQSAIREETGGRRMLAMLGLLLAAFIAWRYFLSL